MAIKSINHTGVSVADIDRSLRFYLDVTEPGSLDHGGSRTQTRT